MKMQSEEELEILAGYLSQIGEEIESYKTFEKISNGLYRGEKQLDDYFGDRKRLQIEFDDDNCTIERISTSTTEFESRTGNLLQQIFLNINTDKFIKEKDKIIWEQAEAREMANSNDYFTSGFTTYDINSEQYMSYTIRKYHSNRVVNSKNIYPTLQKTKVAELKDDTPFPNIAEYYFETLTKSGDTDRNESRKKSM